MGIRIIGVDSTTYQCWTDCAETYWVRFRDLDAYGHQTYQPFLRRGSHYVWGRWINMNNTGDDTVGCVTAAYFNTVPGLDYELGVRRWRSDTWQEDQAIWQHGTFTAPVWPYYSYCEDCCTQAVSRYYAGAFQKLTNDYARGLKFDLETSWGKLCARHATQPACFSCTWGGVSARVEDTVRHWTQVGFQNGHITVADTTVRYDTAVYVEILPHLSLGGNLVQRWRFTADQIFDWLSVDIRQEGESLNFELYYPGTGDLEFWVNNQRFLGLGNRFVNPYHFQVVQFAGEITHWENDMAGSASDSCWFRNCMYMNSAGTWVPAVLDTLDSFATDAAQWGAAVFDGGYSGDSLAIWDLIRLPSKK